MGWSCSFPSQLFISFYLSFSGNRSKHLHSTSLFVCPTSACNWFSYVASFSFHYYETQWCGLWNYCSKLSFLLQVLTGTRPNSYYFWIRSVFSIAELMFAQFSQRGILSFLRIGAISMAGTSFFAVDLVINLRVWRGIWDPARWDTGLTFWSSLSPTVTLSLALQLSLSKDRGFWTHFSLRRVSNAGGVCQWCWMLFKDLCFQHERL